MPYDALVAAAIATEVELSLLGGRVERVVLPEEWSLGIEIYAQGKRRWLLLSADPQRPQVHLSGERLARQSERISPFLLLCRKYVKDSRLEAVISELWERTLQLRFRKRGDDGLFETTTLFVEIMGRHSNLVLVAPGGRIRDSMRRVTAEQSRVRPILPGLAYSPPPLQDKPTLSEFDCARATQAASSSAGQSAEKLLVALHRGCSPQLARELVFRSGYTSTVKATAVDWQRLEEELRGLLQERAREPVAGWTAEHEGQTIDFFAYEPRQHEEWVRHPSISEAVERYYAGRSSVAQRGDTGKAELLARVDSLLEKQQRKLVALRHSLEGLAGLEKLREQGELLLAHAHEIPAGQRSFRAAGQEITLDPRLTAVENAQVMFGDYRKRKSGMAGVPQLLSAAELDIAYLQQARHDASISDSAETLAEVSRALAEQGFVASGPRKQGKRARVSLPLRFELPSGATVLVGRNAVQNWQLTFEQARADDWWLHARGVAGSHVILQRAGGTDATDLPLAAGIAAYYSAGRVQSQVEVDYTQRRNVRRQKGGRPGAVHYSMEKTIRVQPRLPEQGR